MGYCAGVGYEGTATAPTYPNNMVAFMERNVDLSGLGSAQMSFWHKIPSIEECCDSARVYVDGIQLWSANTPVSAWTEVVVDLAPFVGAAHLLRFEFVSDVSITAEGWYLDDVLVMGTAPPPPNDRFVDAEPLTGSSGTQAGTNLEATAEPGEPAHAGQSGGRSVWYVWAAPQNGPVTFNTLGSAFDTLLAVYTGGSVSALTPVAANDDYPGTTASSVTFLAVANTTYYLAVDGYLGASGSFTLNWLYPQVTDTLLTLGITNFTTLVIDADAANPDPAYDRDVLRVETKVRLVNGSSTPHFTSYALSYRLLGLDGQPHPIYDVAGLTNATATYTETYSFPLAASATVTNTLPAAVRPAARLNPYARYRLEVRLLPFGVDIGQSLLDAEKAYYHFTNLVSGDAALNVIAVATLTEWKRIAALKTVAGRQAFLADASFALLRYDNFSNASNPVDAVPVRLTYQLIDAATGTTVPLKTSVLTTTELVPSYQASTPRNPSLTFFTRSLTVEPLDSEQLDPVNRVYRLAVTVAHTDQPGQSLVAGNTSNSADQRLLHFNGHLFFGGIDTLFASIDNDPGIVSAAPLGIRTTLGVDAQSGWVVGHPDYRYGDGTDLAVILRANGNAELTSGSVNLTKTSPGPTTNSVAHVRYELTGPITLSPSGANATVTVTLPTGMGITTASNATFVEPTLGFSAQPLNQDLAPLNSELTVVTLAGNPMYVFEETKPLLVEASTLTWEVANGAFRIEPTPGRAVYYVRAQALNDLQAAAPGLAESDMWFKRSNEQYFRWLKSTVSPKVRVAANSAGAAEMTAAFDLHPGAFFGHFPFGASVQWLNQGLVSIDRDLLTSSSVLSGTTNVALFYYRGCLDTTCPPEITFGFLKFNADADQLWFTADGGLSAQGSLSETHDLSWGEFKKGAPPVSLYAQQARGFVAAGFHLPGAFLRGDLNPQPSVQGPAVLQLSGVATNRLSVDRPLGSAYLQGSNDYAGLNFRVGANGAKQGHSYLGGVPSGLYALTGRSKYYARWGGVSGIHEAVGGTFPAGLTVYDYPLQFTSYGLSYLGSQVHESRTDGQVSLPYPAQFDQPFERLKFSCLGDLTEAEVPGADLEKKLQYWQADFKTSAIDFRRNPGADCQPGTGWLVLGVTAYASNVKEPLFGELGFRPDGNLIPYSQGLEGVNSRLQPPNVIQLQGPGSEKYTFAPVAEAYLNNYTSLPGPPGGGFLNLAGNLDLPFFEDLKVHVQTGAKKTNQTDLIYMMGGWPTEGWSAGTKNFFTVAPTDPPFDPDNRGYAPGISLDQYRRKTTSGLPSDTFYAPRAQKTWVSVVDFDLPLNWDTGTRSFRSVKRISKPVLVLDIDHEAKYVSPQHAELVFGAQYKGLPQLNLANLAFNAVKDASGAAKGVANAVAKAAGEPVRGVVQAGFAGLDRILDAQLDELLKPVFDAQLTPVIDSLYASLQAGYAGAADAAAFKSDVQLRLQGFIEGVGPYASGNQHINDRLDNLVGLSPASGVNVLAQLDAALAAAEGAVDGVIGAVPKPGGGTLPGLLTKNASGQRAIARQLAKEILDELAPQFLPSATDAKLDALLAEAEAGLAQITAELQARKAALSALRSSLASGDPGSFRMQLRNTVNAQGAAIDALTGQIRQDVFGFFAAFDYATGSPFVQYPPAQLKAMIRKKVEDRFFGSVVAQEIQQILRQRVYDVDAAVRSLVDSGFRQVNRAIEDVVSETLAEVDTAFAGFLGDFGNVMRGSRVTGYAHITGDSLKELRLDGRFRWSVPDNLEFGAWLRIKELHADGKYGCPLGPQDGETAAEVALGADQVPLDWISPDLHANLGAKFTFASGTLRGMAGWFDVLDGPNFATFQASKLKATVAFGADEAYIGGTAGLRFDGHDFEGGMFFGRTCTLDPLELIDPQVAKVLGSPPFTGGYAFGEGWVPILGGSCAFRISAGLGAGAFYFAEGPTYGGKMVAGVSGEALCTVSVSGKVSMVGVKQGDDYRYHGKGTIKGKAGECPFCVKFKKTVTLTYDHGWDVDY
jgi:hypothetical protein